MDEPGFLANFFIDDNRDHFCSVHKGVVPIARMRVLLDQDDIGDGVSFRCPKCSKCLTCKKSQRSTAVSLQEAGEQVIIEQSVKIGEENNTVIAKYPFLKDPLEFLSARHNNSNNFDPALKVYSGQCRKREEQRQGMRLVHQELIEKAFMKKLSDCEEDIQNFIKEAAFQHYNPWRIVLKEGSISTPVRMVVDSTMRSFKLLLAKSENCLGYIFDIIARNRCRQNAWRSDISKLYNQLHLDISAIPYSLFLFHNSLDPNIEPEVWVMTIAWYGISSTGGQAGAAIIKLIGMTGPEDQDAVETLEKDIFVNDLL